MVSCLMAWFYGHSTFEVTQSLHTEKGLTLEFMLCSFHLEIINHLNKNPICSFGLGLANSVASPAALHLIPLHSAF